jgi:preprotein translocase subunit YajC
MGALILLAVTFLLMWVLFILPQQRRMRSHQALVARLEVGDEVMTTSGMYGTVIALDGDVVQLEIAAGTVVRLARGAVARRLTEETAPTDTPQAEAPPLGRPSSTAADRVDEEE